MLVDVDTRGYYRINYDENTWKDLIVQLLENHTEISPNARVRLIGKKVFYYKIDKILSTKKGTDKFTQMANMANFRRCIYTCRE